MKRDINHEDLGTKMEELGEPFKFKYHPAGPVSGEVKKSDDHFFGQLGWLIPAEMTLSGINLAEKIGDKPHIYQHSDMNFDPHDLIVKGLGVLSGKTDYFWFGRDAALVTLRFEYPTPENVRISLAREINGKRVLGQRVSFNPDDVKPATLKRKQVAYELLRYHNDLFEDVMRYGGEKASENVVIGQQEMATNKTVVDLFKAYNAELTKVSDKSKDPQ